MPICHLNDAPIDRMVPLPLPAELILPSLKLPVLQVI